MKDKSGYEVEDDDNGKDRGGEKARCKRGTHQVTRDISCSNSRIPGRLKNLNFTSHFLTIEHADGKRVIMGVKSAMNLGVDGERVPQGFGLHSVLPTIHDLSLPSSLPPRRIQPVTIQAKTSYQRFSIKILKVIKANRPDSPWTARSTQSVKIVSTLFPVNSSHTFITGKEISRNIFSRFGERLQILSDALSISLH